MEREHLITAIKYADINKERIKELQVFINENKELTDDEFFNKLSLSKSWLEYAYKNENLILLSKIESHLFFFKILAIISIAASITIWIIMTS